jgi:hypothetical protein
MNQVALAFRYALVRGMLVPGSSTKGSYGPPTRRSSWPWP